MKGKWQIQKLVYLLISGTFFTLPCFSLASAKLLFSPDIPAQIGDQLFREWDIVFYKNGSEIFPLYSFAKEGVNIDACCLFEGYVVFSMDIATEMDL